MDIRTVGVIGAGTMGHGIAQTLIRHGFGAVLIDVDPGMVERGRAKIHRGIERELEKGRISKEEREQALTRLHTTTDLEALREVPFLIEAVFEEEQVKIDLFRRIDSICPPATLFSSNTSSISITAMAAATRRPDKFIGMHFMNPVPVMKLVEVIRAEQTSDATCKITMELAEKLGKTAVQVNDYPGFIANRILMPMINEAVFALMEKVASREAIDTVMKLGMNHPMGPLALADFIGLDICLSILEVLHRGLGDPKYRPCPLLRRLVAAGHLGRKSGRGFYSYEDS